MYLDTQYGFAPENFGLRDESLHIIPENIPEIEGDLCLDFMGIYTLQSSESVAFMTLTSIETLSRINESFPIQLFEEYPAYINLLVLARVIQGHLPKNSLGVPIKVNLPPNVVLDPTCRKQIKGIIRTARPTYDLGIHNNGACDGFAFELTEETVPSDLEILRICMQDLGHDWTLDDFGGKAKFPSQNLERAGINSLNDIFDNFIADHEKLLALGIHKIKLDSSFLKVAITYPDLQLLDHFSSYINNILNEGTFGDNGIEVTFEGVADYNNLLLVTCFAANNPYIKVFVQGFAFGKRTTDINQIPKNIVQVFPTGLERKIRGF